MSTRPQTQAIMGMRRRKFNHKRTSTNRKDVLVEDIDAYYASLTQKNVQETNCPVANIHNLVGTAQICHPYQALNLRRICQMIPNTVYDKKKFAAITIRVSKPSCTILLFTSGKMVLTGCRTYIECISTSLFITHFLRRGFQTAKLKLSSVCIQNIVGNVELQDTALNLEQIYAENHLYCMYQRNMFPGLVFRPDNSPVVLLIFSSGRIVITGAKTREDILYGWRCLWPFVQKYVHA